MAPQANRFRRRLQRSIFKRLHRLIHGDEFFMADYFGARFVVRASNVIGREIAAGTCDLDQLNAFTSACARLRPAVFLDIGANAGLYTCILLKQDLVRRAIAFEPDRRNAVHLRANLLINDLLERVDLRELAVSDAPGRLRLVPGPESNTGASRLAAAGDAEGYEVDVVRLDDVLRLADQTIAIKIDVEFHETEVLAGMTRLLTANRGIAQIETWDRRDAVIATMQQHGWRLVAEITPDLIFEKS
jgi:FkbM family methyltransferase